MPRPGNEERSGKTGSLQIIGKYERLEEIQIAGETIERIMRMHQ